MSETEQRPDGAAVDEQAPNGATVDTALPADIAADSIGSYFRVAFARVRAGESGMLPVIAGLILISIVFQAMNSNFLTAANLVNLLVQSAVFSLLAMAEVFVLLLGDIDLSVGFVAGLSAAIMAVALGPHHNWPLVAAVGAALLACAGIGLVQVLILNRIGLPSFVVTLAGFLFWQGELLRILGNGGSVGITNTYINDIAASSLTPAAGWIVMLVLVAVYGGLTWRRDDRRRKSGLVAPPASVTLLKIAGA